MTKMTKTLTAIAAAATLAVAAVAAPQPAEARGGAIAAGIIGGLAAGAIIGAAANSGYYGPGYLLRPRHRSITAARPATGPTSGSGTAGAGIGGACGFATRQPGEMAPNESKSPESEKIPGFFEWGYEPLRSNFRHIKPASLVRAGTGFKSIAWRSAPADQHPGGIPI